MPYQASINATPEQKALRNVARIKTLRGAIEKHTARGNTEKVAELQAEHDRRMEEIKALRAELESL
jgi:hypothetical protein